MLKVSNVFHVEMDFIEDKEYFSYLTWWQRNLSVIEFLRNRNRNRNLQISKAPLESQAQGTRLFTSAASSQKGCPRE